MTSIFDGKFVAEYMAKLEGEEFKGYIEEMGFYNNGCVVALRRTDAEIKFVAVGDGEVKDREWVMLEGRTGGFCAAARYSTRTLCVRCGSKF